MLVSLFLMAELLPVLHGLGNRVIIFAESSLKIWVSIKIALSLLIVDMLFKEEFVSSMLNHTTLMDIIFSFLMASLLLVHSWTLWIVIRVSINWCWRGWWWHRCHSNVAKLDDFDLINEVWHFILWII